MARKKRYNSFVSAICTSGVMVSVFPSLIGRVLIDYLVSSLAVVSGSEDVSGVNKATGVSL